MEDIVAISPQASQVEAQRLMAERLRRLRKANGLTLKQLADAAGTSASFISQLERGLTGASTTTLMRIANCFGCSLSELFSNAHDPKNPVLRRAERPALPVVDGHRKMLVSQRPLTQFECYASVFEKGSSSGAEQYSHGDSHEMILVLSGRVQIELGPDSYEMEEGDSIEFTSSTPHRVVNIADGRSSVLYVTSPPTSSSGYLDGFKKYQRDTAVPPEG